MAKEFEVVLTVSGGSVTHEHPAVRRHVLDEMEGNAGIRGILVDVESLSHYAITGAARETRAWRARQL